MKHVKVLIRRANKKDEQEITKCWIALMNFHVRFNRKSNLKKKDYVARYRKYLRKRMKSKNAAVFVAECNSRIAGHAMVHLNKLPSIYLLDKEGYVDELFVRASGRGNGVGTLLLEECEKWSRKKKLHWLSLNSHVKNAVAVAIYKKYGLAEHHLKLIKSLV